jgi:hypothetical protein
MMPGGVREPWEPGVPAGIGRSGTWALLTAGTGFLGEKTRIEAPITTTRNTPTEMATSSIFFFSI